MASVMWRSGSGLMLLAVGGLPLGLVQCEQPRRSDPPTERPSPATTKLPAQTESTAIPPLASPAPPASTPVPFVHPAGNTAGCPDGMVRVTGAYCPGVIQTCEEYHEEYLHSERNGLVSERCLKFKEPSRCVVDQRKTLDFCMDRYEYPNQPGELPWVLTSWRQAQLMCREQGKRLCSEDEYNFACEGPEMLPYVTGYVRDASKCNIDREYQRPDHGMRLLTYQRCLADETCKAELERLDQRHAIGSSLSCVSWAGVVDLNGNVNEWVRRPHKEPPNRSGLKGGWWGPVRNRCRPTVGFHKEFDYGYEAGFRCCKGLGPESPDPRYEAERFRISPEQLEARKAEQEARDEAQRPLTTGGPAAPVAPEPARSDARVPSRPPESGEASRSPATGDALEPALSTAPPARSSAAREERKPPAAAPPSAASSPSAAPPASPRTPQRTPAPAPTTVPPAPRRDAPAPAPSSAPPSSASAR